MPELGTSGSARAGMGNLTVYSTSITTGRSFTRPEGSVSIYLSPLFSQTRFPGSGSWNLGVNVKYDGCAAKAFSQVEHNAITTSKGTT